MLQSTRYRDKRNRAYAKRYNMGKNCLVEYDVELTRQHYCTRPLLLGQKSQTG